MKEKLTILTIIFFSLCSALHGQQYDNWYFGRRAAISFTPNGSQATPYSLSNSAMVSDEAAASFSDENGNLLFYTNGVTVYNKLHAVMLNGDNLMGNISSCQIAIVPNPGNDSIFYLFTTDALENDFNNGYRYSVINSKGDNGKGEVITKNVLLWSSCTERLATVRHANGIDVWVITNDNRSNIFRAWLVTCNGVVTSPVVSTTGIVLDQFREMNAGIIKISPDGKKIVQTHFPIFEEFGHPPNFFQLFDFNNNSGIFSNPRNFSFPDAQFTHCEFSPDGKLLYLSRPYEKKIDQLEITLPTTGAILSSRISLPTLSACYDLQLAPDEKIYCAAPSLTLSVINRPNQKAPACNLQENQLSLLSGSSFLGLPSHTNDISDADNPDNGFSFFVLDSCSGTVQFSAHSNLPGTIIWEWNFGDGQTSSAQNPQHIFASPSAVYTVRLKIRSALSCGAITKTKRITPSGVSAGNAAFDFVVRCDSAYVRFINTSTNLSNLIGSFMWDFGDGNNSVNTDPVHSYVLPGNYNVKLKINSLLSCLSDSVTLPVVVNDFSIKTIPDQTIRVGQSVFLSTDQPASTYTWQPALWLSDTSIRNPLATPLDDITYKIMGTSGDGCKGEDSVTIHVHQYDDIYVPTGFTPNNDGRNDLIQPFYPGDLTLRNFIVVNRWGQTVFTTSRRNAGWDGKINGQVQQAGLYVWSILLTDNKGVLTERKGTFVLIR